MSENYAVIADVLDQTATEIERAGWTGGPVANWSTGKQCIMTAMPSGAHFPGMAFLAEFLGRPEDCRLDNGHYIIDWNDAPGRTQDEVVTKLREAATKARELAA